MSDVWTPDEGAELELLALRRRVHELEGEVIRLEKLYRNERSLRLGLDPQKKRKKPPRKLPGPKLWTVTDDKGVETKAWMYTTEVIAAGIGVVRDTVARWIREGLIPEAGYRSYDGKRLWTQAQVKFIFAIFDERRVDPNWRKADQAAVWRNWPDGTGDWVFWAERKTIDLPPATTPPKRKEQ